ncbi:hypothetical protein [Roseomonas sp. WA12]
MKPRYLETVAAELPNLLTGLRAVSKEEFFAEVGPRDIVLRTPRFLARRGHLLDRADVTEWETRQRIRVGVSVSGWAGAPARPVTSYYLSGEA